MDSPTPCGPSGRCIAALPSFAVLDVEMPKAKGSSKAAFAAAKLGSPLGMPPAGGGSEAAAASSSSSSSSAWPVDAQLQGALQVLLAALSVESGPSLAEPPAGPELQRSWDASDSATPSRGEGGAAADESRTSPSSPSRASGKGGGRIGKGRSSPAGSGSLHVTPGKSAGADAVTSKKRDLDALLRPLQIESPQMVSDFFRMLKKMGVEGVERCTQILEEHASLLDSKRSLQERVVHLEHRAQDLELLNLQYRALLYAEKRSASGALSSSASVDSEDVSPGEKGGGVGTASSGSSAGVPTPRSVSKEGMTARGWGPATPSTRSPEKSTEVAKDAASGSHVESPVPVITTPLGSRELRGWSGSSSSGTRTRRTPSGLPASSLEPAAEEDASSVLSMSHTTASDERRVHCGSSAGTSASSSRAGLSGAATCPAVSAPSSSAGEASDLARQLNQALRSRDALGTESFYLKHLFQLTSASRGVSGESAVSFEVAGVTEEVKASPSRSVESVSTPGRGQ